MTQRRHGLALHKTVQRRRWIRWFLTVSLAAAVLIALFHRPLLRGLAQAWIVEQSAGPADAIVVSTGASREIFAQALTWWREGKAPRLVLTLSKTQSTESAGITMSRVEFCRQQLDAAGVPKSACEFIGKELRLLSEEIPAVQAWASTNDVKRILMPSEPFTTRRIAWLARRTLHPAGIELTVVPVTTAQYSAHEWWRTKEGLLAMENEWAMMVYYWWCH